MKYLILSFFIISNLFAQESKLLERLSALQEPSGRIWYNIDGYIITSQIFDLNFDEEGLKQVYEEHKVVADDTKIKDDSIRANNYVVRKTQKHIGKTVGNSSCYFIETKDKKIMVVWFSSISEDLEVQRELTNLIIEDKIPQANFASAQPSSINFGNRRIQLWDTCHWEAVNSLQCPYNGQINWSVYSTLEKAQEAVETQLLISKEKAKVLTEKFVDVEFEGVPTKARRVVLIFKGLMEGKMLVIYYVAEKVRGNYIGCVMSHWNDDRINPETKLPPLLEKVMKFK